MVIKFLVKRLLLRGKDSGRPDDSNESIIRNRIKVYNEQTSVVADFYEAKGRFQKINGVGSIEEIFDKIWGDDLWARLALAISC